ncbi:MAG: dipicolinate synthase subunit DpsA [Candidatus Improbicoccus devescovinae]|nr:MAG: dipicolinate synthase subunit DpsA [Candidatus Improbicoccus devescovinae]
MVNSDIKQEIFAIICGDNRQIFLANLLKHDLHSVHVYGFDDEILKTFGFLKESLDEVINKSTNIILPIPVSREGDKILMSNIEINSEFIQKIKNKRVFCGMKNKVKNPEFQNLDIKDYYDCENFKILNSIPTAEGALKLALDNSNQTIYGSTCLIAGYGRIGKILAKILKDLGANVYINTISEEDKTWSQTWGYKIIDIQEAETLDFDFIFNTVPELIFDKFILNKISSRCVIIDLASIKGVDYEYAKKLGIQASQELGVSGRFFALTSAKIIKQSIYNIM